MTTASTVSPTLRGPQLLGQTVVAIGGSCGIGLETARRARAEGADVVLTGRNPRRGIGFRYRGEASYRMVQLTPPGSECSIQIGNGITDAKPGSYQGLYLITSDLESTRAEFLKRGVDVSEPFCFGPKGQTSGLHPERADYNGFASTFVCSKRARWKPATKSSKLPIDLNA